MRGKIALLISFLVILSFFSACTTSELLVNGREVYGCIQEPIVMDPTIQEDINEYYELMLADCKANCSTCNCEADAKIVVAEALETGWQPGLLGREVTLPYSYSINRCSPSPNKSFNWDLGIDLEKCSEFLEILPVNPFTTPFIIMIFLYELETMPPIEEGCEVTPYKNYNLPANSICGLKEDYLLVMTSTNPNPINVNGYIISPTGPAGPGGVHMFFVYFYSPDWNKTLIDEIIDMGSLQIESYNEIPSSINITRTAGEEITVFLYRECCWHCNPTTTNKKLPAAILYPKIDIESFTLSNGTTIIQDGKILYSFNAPRGVQNTTIGIENRGFFSQNNVFIKFIGLPNGITVNTSPEFQKIKAHQIGEYEATFTVSPNVPSGTYKVTMIAYSANGTFDTITIDLIVP